MKQLFIFLLLGFQVQISFSESRHSHDAHTHGLADLTVVYENSQLYIELESPGANVLGFEHEPRTERDRAEVERVSTLLQQPDVLFGLSPACEVVSVDVDVPFSSKSASQRSDDEHHHDHDADDTGSAHADVRLSYQWTCSGKSTPDIQVNLFNEFSGFETIKTQWIINGKQGSMPLSKHSSKLEFN